MTQTKPKGIIQGIIDDIADSVEKAKSERKETERLRALHDKKLEERRIREDGYEAKLDYIRHENGVFNVSISFYDKITNRMMWENVDIVNRIHGARDEYRARKRGD